MTMARHFETTTVPFESSLPSGSSAHEIDRRTENPMFRSEDDDGFVLSTVQNFEASDWLRDANATATRRWNLLVVAHHSFADPFWEKERERILARRTLLLANSVENGFPTASAVEYKSLGTILYHIESAIAEYRGRDLALSGMIKSLRDGIDRSSTPENRRSRTAEMYLLLSVLRNKEVDIVAVVQELLQMSSAPGISQSRQEQLARHIERIGFQFSIDDIGAEHLVSEDVESDTDSDADTEKIDGPTIIPAEDLKPIQFTPEGKADSLALSKEEDEQGAADRARLIKAEKMSLLGFLELTRQVIDDELGRKPDLSVVVEMNDALEEQLGDQLSEIADYAADYPEAHVDASRYRFATYEDLLPLVAADIALISASSGKKKRADYLGSSFIEVAKEFLKTRLRYEMWREYLLQEGGHSLLGVPRDADQQSIERAFAAEMQMLDFDRVEDRRQIANLQQARERLLMRAEAREKEEAPRRAEEKRRREEEAARAHHAWLLNPVGISVPENIAPVPQVEAWWSSTLRTPGAKIRTLFAGALGLGAVAGVGAIALREFGESESEPSHLVAGALENAPPEGVDIDRDTDTEGPGPAIARQEAAPTTDFIVEGGDTLWRELKQRIEDRGLRVTDQKIFMLKHLADEENPTVDWDRLQVGQTIHLASVEHMLDEMEGKPVSAKTMQSLPSSLDGGSFFASELENIPASTFSEEVARLNQSVDHAETSSTPKEKAYQGLPTVDHPVRAIKKGEYIFKVAHGMLRASGLNWTTERINFLNAVVLEQNHMTEAQAERLPVGTLIDFSEAAKIIAEMKADVAAGRKSKTVRQLKAARAKQK